MSRTICLGYYDQHNLGDECFKLVLRDLIVYAQGVDEVWFINPCGRMSEEELISVVHDIKTRAVVVGGGDLIRDFWMPKIKRILKDFTRPKLAISVGISYPDCAPYLRFFDRIIVRSSADLSMIKPIRSEAEFYFDVSSVLGSSIPPRKVPSETEKSIGICLAHPCLPVDDRLKKEMIDLLVQEILEGIFLYNSTKTHFIQWRLHLLPFNTNASKVAENDIIPQALFLESFHRLCSKLPSVNVEIDVVDKALDTYEMLSTMCDTDLTIGMRYHSIMFSLITKTPFIAVYSQPKIKNLLCDVEFASSQRDVPIEDIPDKLRRSITNVIDSCDVGVTDTATDFYRKALQTNDITATKSIIRDENVLFIPSSKTLESIISKACLGKEISFTIETLRSKENHMIINEFLLNLLRETRKACQPSGDTDEKSDIRQAEQYVYGFNEALGNNEKASSSFRAELEWIIHHFIRNA